MGLNFRRSIKIGKHTRLNFTKSGVGISTGVKGAGISVGPRGVRKTVGIPGTGIYYTKQSSWKKDKNHAYVQSVQPVYQNLNMPKKPLSAAGRFGYRFTAIIAFIVAAFSFLCGIPILPAGIILWAFSAFFIYLGALCLKKAKTKTEEETVPPANVEDAPHDSVNSENMNVKTEYDFLTLKVAGVTFKNGRKTRQAILRKIKFKDPPFDKPTIDITITPYEFEGEQAYGIYVEGEQIGNVPREYIQYLMDNWERRDTITAINVYGGGTTDDGERRNYGAEITVRFYKHNQTNT